MHRRPPIAAAAFVAALALFASAPAVAGWGAIAYDEQSGQLGIGWWNCARSYADDRVRAQELTRGVAQRNLGRFGLA